MNKTQILSIITKPFESKTGFYVDIRFSISREGVNWFDYFYKTHYLNVYGVAWYLKLYYDLETHTFIYHNAITSSPASEGILQYLEDLIEESQVKGNFSLESNIERSLLALNQFWD